MNETVTPMTKRQGETPSSHRGLFRGLLWLTVLVVVGVCAGRAPAQPAAALPANCYDGQHSGSAFYLICMPEPRALWNGQLIVYAHGYVSPTEPVAIPEDQLVFGGTSIPDLVNQTGFAFAATSYGENGLAVLPAIDDVVDLVDVFRVEEGDPTRVYLAGVSEGGLVTALAVERHPEIFDGGLAACGPIGNFRRQVDYFGDVRVLFDYFFPNVIPGSAVEIPDDVITGWESIYEPAVRDAIRADPAAARQLLRVARIPADPADPAAAEDAIVDVLWYNIFATNDASARLGGQPFDNHRRWYFGSSNDFRLNFQIARFTADPAALVELAKYETSGKLAVPLVATHTTGDPVIPYWHEPLYRLKAFLAGSSRRHANIPVFAYGHCAFSETNALVALAVLVFKASGGELAGVAQILQDAGRLAEFRQRIAEFGASAR